MTRSKKGGKGPGAEFWSKRPCSKVGIGPVVKAMTKAKERMQRKKDVAKELREVEE